MLVPNLKENKMASANTSSESKETPAKSTPRDARAMKIILKEMGIEDYEPRVINQMLEFTYRYVTNVLEDARVYCNHGNKKEIDADDIKLAVQIRMDHSFTSPPPRDFLMEIARQKNSTPLPLIQPRSGLRLPPDRYCLLSNNYRVKQQQKKQQPRTTPTVPARSLPHYPLTSSAGLKLSQPSIAVSLKPMPVTGPTAATIVSKIKPNTTAPTTMKPVVITTPLVNKPAVQSSMAVMKTQGNIVQSAVKWSQPNMTGKSSTPQAPNQSITTVSALPSMDETVASSLQQQALVSSLKRKREGEDDDDYDA